VGIRLSPAVSTRTSFVTQPNPSEARSLAAVIDHTLLKPDAGAADIARVCEEAVQFGFASVCINPCWVTLAARLLAGSGVRVCTVAGFPFGANVTRTKVYEAGIACEQGAAEIDMVLNIGALRGGEHHLVHKDISDVAEVVRSGGRLLKVILETSLLSDQQKVRGCRLAVEAGADFVKTSTGFSGGGATAADVRLMRETVGDGVGVKASGGIRTLASLREMLAAGATRIGASARVDMMHELEGAAFASSPGNC
jgi:deoxyribose-phosphate aldolase